MKFKTILKRKKKKEKRLVLPCAAMALKNKSQCIQLLVSIISERTSAPGRDESEDQNTREVRIADDPSSYHSNFPTRAGVCNAKKLWQNGHWHGPSIAQGFG